MNQGRPNPGRPVEVGVKVRFPKFDFSSARAHWTTDPEFAQGCNASSLIPAHVEPYLLKVMRTAREKLDPSNARLIQELDIFCKQEMQHMKHHLAFNKLIRSQGYEGLKPFEDRLAGDYEDFLKNKSLAFNLAYCEGFESLSASACESWFEDYDDYLKDADPVISDMWRWHLAEEFEHRTVCADVFHELGGSNPVSRYFRRIYGFFYAVRHLRGFGQETTAYLVGRDRESMTSDEVQASIVRQAAVKKRLMKRALPMMIKILSPFYDPAKRRVPNGQPEFLREFEQRRDALAA